MMRMIVIKIIILIMTGHDYGNDNLCGYNSDALLCPVLICSPIFQTSM